MSEPDELAAVVAEWRAEHPEHFRRGGHTIIARVVARLAEDNPPEVVDNLCALESEMRDRHGDPDPAWLESAVVEQTERRRKHLEWREQFVIGDDTPPSPTSWRPSELRAIKHCILATLPMVRDHVGTPKKPGGMSVADVLAVPRGPKPHHPKPRRR